MKYRVSVSFYHFDFNSAECAMDFAEAAKKHFVSDEDKEITVEIEIITEKEES